MAPATIFALLEPPRKPIARSREVPAVSPRSIRVALGASGLAPYNVSVLERAQLVPEFLGKVGTKWGSVLGFAAPATTYFVVGMYR